MNIKRDVVQSDHPSYQLAVLILQIEKVKLCVFVSAIPNNRNFQFAGCLASKGEFLSENSLKVAMIMLKDISTPLHLFISGFFSVSLQNLGDSSQSTGFDFSLPLLLSYFEVSSVSL